MAALPKVSMGELKRRILNQFQAGEVITAKIAYEALVHNLGGTTQPDVGRALKQIAEQGTEVGGITLKKLSGRGRTHRFKVIDAETARRERMVAADTGHWTDRYD